ncbi:unnamed protein product [Miscanthus lutarioriparius]|uniref:Myb/SANT-like domain-containing protein n=1 Tax=Miscanthus lutarioriparius TaxID=422564 RepID=A0A811MMS3_9POAL|nr:unnamed protein product [Miscanthus lutarioriparius]
MDGSDAPDDGHIPDEVVFGHHIFSNSERPAPAPAPRVGLPRPPPAVTPPGDQMEWTGSNVTIACELMAEQVRKGNHPNTHLNCVGYTEVSDRFLQLTGIKLSKTQIKNKWDKLKNDFTAWQKLKRRQTGNSRVWKV